MEASLLLGIEYCFNIILDVEFECVIPQVLHFASPVSLVWDRRNVLPVI